MEHESPRPHDAQCRVACRVEPILIVENNQRESYLVSVALEQEGFKTIVAGDGEQALELARRHNPLFVILDVVLPLKDGWEVCRELRRASDVPILILTAKGAASERIRGLSLGADDYVVKPCSGGELAARVTAILRRMQPDLFKIDPVLSHGELTLDADKRKVTLRGHAVSLTSFEYKLLRALMSAAGRIFLREELLNRLYPNGEAVIDRVIDVHIGNLRRKIEVNPSNPIYILTARGLGYQFAEEAESSAEKVMRVEANYRRFFEDAMIGMYQTTLGGRYVAANPMLARMFGYEGAPELIENTIDLNDGFYVAHERRAEFTDLIREQEGVQGFESQAYRRDGSVIWISEHALALNDAAGNLVGFQGTTIDVTERKLAERVY
ncbi:MAG: response regulator [Pyrinomonadaceae bacterium]